MTGGRQSEGILRQARIAVVAFYLGFLFFANLIWEFSHMPLYTIWRAGSRQEILYSGIHCTFGDLMIAAFSLCAGVLVTGSMNWPGNKRLSVAIATVLTGLSYTAFSEWMNVYQLESWGYSELMPFLPGTGIGLSPMMQWLVLPIIGFHFSYRAVGVDNDLSGDQAQD